jgi:hypothetical protein
VSWAHEHLGIGDDADERAIKRAYAVKLRTTRPDEDPEGFQQLNEAYRQALRIAAWQDANGEDMGTADDEDGHATGHLDTGRDSASWRPVAGPPATRTPPPIPLPSASALPPPEPIDARTGRIDADAIDEYPSDPDKAEARYFDFNAFYEAVEIRIHASYPPDFAEWLEQHPALHDARLKRRIGMRLPQFLKARPTLPTGHVEALVQCFGFGAKGADTEGKDVGFDPGVFLDMLEIEAHSSSPAQFRQSLENHPDLYDIALKQRLAMPVLRFIECTPDLPASHVYALVAFFGLDKVDAHFVHERVQAILTRSAPELEFRQSAPERNQSGYFPIWPIIALIFILGRCASGNY